MNTHFKIDAGVDARSSFPAHAALSLIDTSSTFHASHGYRHPLGIYNTSVLRILRRTRIFCEKLEARFSSEHVGKEGSGLGLDDEILDYLELALYSSAEHIDEIKAIADGFFKSGRQQAKNNTDYKKFDNRIDGYKKRISGYVNAIKHKQSRVRFYSSDCLINSTKMRLYGYFMEGVDRGVVGPHPVFHGNGSVFSLSSLAWEIITFLLQCSWALNEYLWVVAKFFHGPAGVRCDELVSATLAAARLPLYSFDDEHPFDRVLLSIEHAGQEEKIDSGIYGSILKPWGAVITLIPINDKSEFTGDGISCSFRFPSPSRVVIKNWKINKNEH